MQECKQLRGDIDEQHKIRMEAFEFKMQPIVINEEPSRKVKLNIKKNTFLFFLYSRQITKYKVLSCNMISMHFA